ncbi:MAG: hypothetical protein AB7T38_10620 [Nitrospirales bacterium]
MSVEPFVYLAVFLLLALLTRFALWLNEKVREEINLRDLFVQTEAPAEGQDLKTAEAPTPASLQAIAPSSRLQGPRNRRRLLYRALHNKEDLRQGIVLMTVLGPCRALEPPSS